MDIFELRAKANDLLRENNFQAANRLLSQLTQQIPDDPEVWCGLGWSNLHLGDIPTAVLNYKEAIRVAPNSINALFGLAMALGKSGELAQAHSHLNKIMQLDPNHIDARIHLAHIEYVWGNVTAALSLLKKVQRLAPEHVELNTRLGIIYIAMNDFQKAGSFLRKAIRHDPDNPEAISQLATMHAYMGDTAQAYRILSPLLRSKPVYSSAAILFANFCRPLNRCQEATEILEELLSGQTSNENESRIRFSLGRLYDLMGNYTKAFEHIELANKLTDSHFNPWEQKQWVRSVVRQMDADFFKQAPHAKSLSKSIRPVFIVGMPRSGTSLVEQILSNHPAVYGAGERIEIPNIANSICMDIGSKLPYPFCLGDANPNRLSNYAKRYIKEVSRQADRGERIITDKLPDNYMHLGLIQLLFPKSKVVHCRRDPMDTCLSCYSNRLMGHAYSYNLTNLGRYYRLYEELMGHWKSTLSIPILDVQYEEMVDAPESIIRSIVEFCGLKWADRCLDFHKTKRNVITASSDQVRQPIYRHSVARWKNYEEHLGELRSALEQRI